MSKALEILLGIVVVVLVGVILFTLIGTSDSGFMGAVADKINGAVTQITWE